jgi:ParB family chromosome partitioning protein
MELIYLGTGLAVGLVIGVLIAMLRSKGSTGDGSIAIKLASAEATVSGLKAQLETANRERVARDERDREENRLIKEFGLTHELAAQAVGRSRSAASNLLRLLNLADPVQTMLMAGDIDMGHARALLALDRATQITAANQINAKKLSVREAESLVKKLSAEFNLVPQKPKKEKSRDMKRVEEELSDLLTAQVEVRVKKRAKRHGKLEDMGEVAIQFGSLDALNGLIDRWRGQSPS